MKHTCTSSTTGTRASAPVLVFTEAAMVSQFPVATLCPPDWATFIPPSAVNHSPADPAVRYFSTAVTACPDAAGGATALTGTTPVTVGRGSATGAVIPAPPYPKL